MTGFSSSSGGSAGGCSGGCWNRTGSTGAGPAFSDLAKLSIRELGIAPSHLADGLSRAADEGRRYRAAPAPAPARTAEDEEQEEG